MKKSEANRDKKKYRRWWITVYPKNRWAAIGFVWANKSAMGKNRLDHAILVQEVINEKND